MLVDVDVIMEEEGWIVIFVIMSTAGFVVTTIETSGFDICFVLFLS
jgi:hypothetical protein